MPTPDGKKVYIIQSRHVWMIYDDLVDRFNWDEAVLMEIVADAASRSPLGLQLMFSSTIKYIHCGVEKAELPRYT